jgi:hypothetical protein
MVSGRHIWNRGGEWIPDEVQRTAIRQALRHTDPLGPGIW